MTRSELITKLLQYNPNLRQAEAEKIIQNIFEKISHSLGDGMRVELRGFGSFFLKEREERTGRNPRTGEQVFVPKHRVLSFRCGKALHDMVNNPEKTTET